MVKVSLTTLVDLIRVTKARTSGDWPPIDINFVSIFARRVEKSQVLFADPLPYFTWWGISVGGEELKWHQLAHHQLMTQQGPHFSPHSRATANSKSTNLRKIGKYWYK